MTQPVTLADISAAAKKPILLFFAVALALLLAVTSHAFGTGVAAAITAAAAIGGAFGFWIKAGKQVETTPRAHATDAGQALLEISDLIEVLDAPAFVLDDGGNVTAHNRLVRELYPQIATTKPLSHVSRNPELLRAVEEAFTERKARSIQIVDRITQGRRLFASVSPLKIAGQSSKEISEQGRPYLLVQVRDLTEQDRLAQMRSDFIANASHELRTPLASMKGFIETLRGAAREDAGARERFLGIMDAQAARMTRILDDLLSLSRVEMRAHLAPEGDVELGSVLTTVVQGLAPLAHEAKISLKLEPAIESFHTRGDRDQLEQVIQNLVQNAIKYGREGGKVDISARRVSRKGSTGERIYVTVADDGVGIAEQHLPRLTERFYRVDSARSRERGGTGLGLAIVKHILNRHRGELEISSKLGVGSTFTVVLDALPNAIPAVNASGRVASKPPD